MQIPRITHTYLATLKATDVMQNIACGEGLMLRVSPKGKKTWYLRYDTVTNEGKRKQNIVSLGDFPALSLKDARLQADERKALAKDGNTNLAKAKKQAILNKAQNTSASDFTHIAKAWLSLKSSEWSQSTYNDNLSRLSANIFPIIGHRQSFCKKGHVGCMG